MQRIYGMVDVSGKEVTRRVAVAQACVRLKESLVRLIRHKKIAKGNVLEQARVAGILAAKKTPELIPLSHPLMITDITIEFETGRREIRVIARVSAVERTGVEMESLVASTVAALTIYDMCKMYDKSIEITDCLLLSKSGGKSGDYKRTKKGTI